MDRKDNDDRQFTADPNQTLDTLSSSAACSNEERDVDAEFENFLSHGYRSLYRMACNILQRFRLSTFEPEDLAQDVAKTMWEHREGFRGEAALTTYAYTVMVHMCSASHKKSKGTPAVHRQKKSRDISKSKRYQQMDLLDDVIGDFLDRMPKESPTYDVLVAYGRLIISAQITKRQAEIILLKRECHSLEEIASRLRLSKATVSRDYKEFRELIEESIVYESSGFPDESRDPFEDQFINYDPP